MVRLLSIDFDYFIPTPTDLAPDDAKVLACCDWGANESWDLVRDIMWAIRMMQLDRAGIARPMPHPLAEMPSFWSRFNIAESAPVYVADSHEFAYVNPAVRDMVTHVWNYDAHHDAGYHGDVWTEINREPNCENWMVWYHLNHVKIHQRYPLWKVHHMEQVVPCVPVDRDIDGDAPDVLFDRVFVCRSGGWVPPYLDGEFERFVEAAEREIVKAGPLRTREWDEAVVDRARRQIDAAVIEEMTDLLAPDR